MPEYWNKNKRQHTHIHTYIHTYIHAYIHVHTYLLFGLQQFEAHHFLLLEPFRQLLATRGLAHLRLLLGWCEVRVIVRIGCCEDGSALCGPDLTWRSEVVRSSFALSCWLDCMWNWIWFLKCIRSLFTEEIFYHGTIFDACMYICCTYVCMYVYVCNIRM